MQLTEIWQLTVAKLQREKCLKSLGGGHQASWLVYLLKFFPQNGSDVPLLPGTHDGWKVRFGRIK